MDEVALSVRDHLLGRTIEQGSRDEYGVLLGRYLVALANHLQMENRVDVDLPPGLSEIICGTTGMMERLHKAGFLGLTEAGTRVTPEGHGLVRQRRTAYDLEESFVAALARRFTLTLRPPDVVRCRPAPVSPVPVQTPAPTTVRPAPMPDTITQEDEVLVTTYGAILTEVAYVIALNGGLPIITTMVHRIMKWVHAQHHLSVRYKYVRDVRETLAALDLISRVQSSVNPALYNWSLTKRGERLVAAAGRTPTMSEAAARYQLRMNPTML